jgi:hypothetical protein
MTMNAPSLRILTNTLELVADLDRYGELYYTRSLSEPGDFAFSLPLEADTERSVAEGNFLLVGNDGKRIGILEEVEKKALEKGSEWLIARGHEAKAIFARRIILPPAGAARIDMDAPAETIMKALVESQCGPSAAPERQFPGLDIAPDLGRGILYSLSSGYASLLSELSSIAKASGLGFSLCFDPGGQKLIFELIEGIDRSAGQEENPRALFASDYDTLSEARLIQGFGRHASILYVLGAKLAEGRPMALAFDGTEPEGFGRFERTLDAPAFDTTERLAAYGQARLAGYPTTFFLEAVLPEHSSLVPDRDFALGDVCTVHAYGQWYTVPIHSIEEHWTKDGFQVRLGFGRPSPGAFSAAMGAANELMSVLRTR